MVTNTYMRDHEDTPSSFEPWVLDPPKPKWIQRLSYSNLATHAILPFNLLHHFNDSIGLRQQVHTG